MIGLIKITDRGPTPRKLKSVHNRASKASWSTVGVRFHTDFRDLRFRPDHARRAGYYKRKGEGQPFGSTAWSRNYMGQKFKRFGHQRPLEFTGETRRAVASMPSVSSVISGVKVRYPGARKFNFRHPKSRINMREEFTRVLTDEANSLARTYDRQLNTGLNQG